MQWCPVDPHQLTPLKSLPNKVKAPSKCELHHITIHLISPTLFKNLFRDGVLIFEGKRKARVSVAPQMHVLTRMIAVAVQGLLALADQPG